MCGLGDFVADLPPSTGVLCPRAGNLHRSLVVPASPRPLISADECSIAFISDHARAFTFPAIDGAFTHPPGNQNPPSGGRSVVGYPSCRRNSPGLSSPPVRGRALHRTAWKDFDRSYQPFRGRFTSAFKAAAVATCVQVPNGFSSSHLIYGPHGREAANTIVTRQRTSPSVSWPSAPPNVHPEAA